MTIRLSAKDYAWNRSEIDACINGEMCKIMKSVTRRTDPIRPDEIHYTISADVTGGGWHAMRGTGRSFHGTEKDGSTTMTGLGTFHLINATPTSDGGCILDLTDDLNPDLP